MHRVAFICAALGLMVLGACATLWAAEPTRQGRIAAPQQPAYAAPPYTAPAAPEYKAHTFYLGGVGGGAWGENQDFEDGVVQGGIVAGYLWRSGVLGLGVEADYVLRDLGDAALDDGTASIRGRAGMFVGTGTFLYATAGVAQATEAAAPDGLRKGLVVGGGVEKDIAANLALRIEALHYRHADDYFEWGEEGSTAVRGGLVVKF